MTLFVEPTKIKNIILDLDETLISSEEYEKFMNLKSKTKYKLKDITRFRKEYVIFQRPYLQVFLSYIFSHFNVSIWTASDRDYAFFIVKNIVLKDKNRKIDNLFFRRHVDESLDKYKSKKNLNMFYKMDRKYNPSNTLLIDDDPTNAEDQEKNIYLIKPYRYNSKDEDVSLLILLDLLNIK